MRRASWIALVVALCSCGGRGGGSDGGQTVSFSASVRPVLTAECTPCHEGTSPAGAYGVDGTDGVAHTAAVSRVNLADPAQSLLLTKAVGVNHGPFLETTDAGYQLILQWIQGSAPNN